jgi:hypothetical protein
MRKNWTLADVTLESWTFADVATDMGVQSNGILLEPA